MVDTDTLQSIEDKLDNSKKNANGTKTVRIRIPEDLNINVKDTIDTGLKETLDTVHNVIENKEDTIDRGKICNGCYGGGGSITGL